MKVTWRRRKTSYLSGPVLEPKGMHVIFQKNGKKWQKMAKYLKIGVKMYKIWKYFEKGQPHMCGYCMHWNSLNIPWLWNNWMNFNEIFRKNANFNNIKSLKSVASTSL